MPKLQVKKVLNEISISISRLVSFFLLICLIWIGYQYIQDPIDLIDRSSGLVIHSQDSTIIDDYLPKNRHYSAIKLTTSEEETITITISKPQEMPEEGLPVILILGGLEIGTYTLGYIPDPGNNIIIIYNYPYHPEYWYTGTAIKEIPKIRNSVLDVPSQILSLNQWISDQSWSDENRISITGFSFGALFLPAIFNLAQHYKVPVRYGVMAYGGIDIYQLLTTNMTNVCQPFRTIISWLAFSAIRGIEPAHHALNMKGEFYLINGTHDNQIPEENWRALHDLVPEPKTIKILNEGHMHQRKVELTQQVVALTQKWLLEKGVINP